MKEREERDRELTLYLFVWFLRVLNLNIPTVSKCIFVVTSITQSSPGIHLTYSSSLHFLFAGNFQSELWELDCGAGRGM